MSKKNYTPFGNIELIYKLVYDDLYLLIKFYNCSGAKNSARVLNCINIVYLTHIRSTGLIQ